jgi:hypothetical protein
VAGVISVVVEVVRSRMKMSSASSVSPGTRSEARLWKATLVPSGLMAGADEGWLPLSVPAALTDTSVVVPIARSRTQMS